MSHQAQIDFCLSVQHRFPDLFKRKDVLDIGSMDINGNNRYLFDECNYVGIDLGAGKNVDLIYPNGAHTYKTAKIFDVVISTECFEHDRHYLQTFQYMIEKSSKLVLFTCATVGRDEHGTERTRTSSSPFTTDYYKNLTQRDFEKWFDFDDHFERYAFEVNNENHDLYFYGIKR